MLAALLQVMPFVRTAIPALTEGLAPSTWAIVLRWAIGAGALLGFDAVSSASSIAISPPTAKVGVPYVGTVTYSGGHAGSVSSMSFSNVCLGSAVTLAPGLTIIYNGGNTASVTGTPTTNGNFNFTLKMFDAGGCGSFGNTDTRSTALVVNPSGSGGVPPAVTAPPQNITAQAGSDVLLSAGASGNPSPNYYWYLGLPSPSTLISTNSTASLKSVQYSNAGLYTVVASNASGTATATAYVSVALTPGSNQLALNYTNYYPQGHALTMSSFLTNVPAGTTTYKWQYNFVDITTANATNYNLALNTNQVTGSKSGTYSVVFNSTVGTNTIVNQQAYYSFWVFGAPPSISAQPQSTNVTSGQNATFAVAATGSNTLSYQWVLNQTNILAGQTNATLTISNAAASADGSYSVIVTNYFGTTNSAAAVLNVSGGAQPPTIGISAGNGSVQLSASSQPGATCITQTTTNLGLPWVSISTNTVPPSGTIVLTNSITNAAQFFRFQFP